MQCLTCIVAGGDNDYLVIVDKAALTTAIREARAERGEDVLINDEEGEDDEDNSEEDDA